MIQIVLNREGGEVICRNPSRFNGDKSEWSFPTMADAERGLKWYQAGWPDNDYRIKVS
jgi:hypothetical protein